MAKTNYSGLFRQEVIVDAYSTLTVDFLDRKPNYFLVNNTGNGTLYAATTRTPTAKVYDFSIGSGKTKMYSEPFSRDRMLIYNPNGSACRVTITSFAYEFDPLTLAFSNFEFEIGDVALESDMSISSFKTALPAGTNKLGSVGVDEFKTSLPTGNNKIGIVSIDGDVNVKGFKDYSTALANILTAIGNIPGGGGSGGGSYDDTELMQRVDMIAAAAQGYFMNMNTVPLSFEGTATTTAVNIGGSSMYMGINYLSNDGNSDLIINYSLIAGDGITYGAQTITLKAGEVVNDLNGFGIHNITVKAASGEVPYRAMLKYSHEMNMGA